MCSAARPGSPDLLDSIKNKGGEARCSLTSIPICSHVISHALSWTKPPLSCSEAIAPKLKKLLSPDKEFTARAGQTLYALCCGDVFCGSFLEPEAPAGWFNCRRDLDGLYLVCSTTRKGFTRQDHSSEALTLFVRDRVLSILLCISAWHRIRQILDSNPRARRLDLPLRR